MWRQNCNYHIFGTHSTFQRPHDFPHPRTLISRREAICFQEWLHGGTHEQTDIIAVRVWGFAFIRM
jgi:hypothetical protein